jgi:outer membrane protein assembly factor BamD
MTRIAILAVLTLLLPGWTQPSDKILRFVESTEIPEKPADEIVNQQADKDMYVGRHEIEKRNYIGALNRFKTVVTRFQTSRHVEEALARLTEIYLALGIPSEAQNAAAVLVRKFPNGRWSAEARDALKTAGLEPAENENSWMSRPFK